MSFLASLRRISSAKSYAVSASLSAAGPPTRQPPAPMHVQFTSPAARLSLHVLPLLDEKRRGHPRAKIVVRVASRPVDHDESARDRLVALVQRICAVDKPARGSRQRNRTHAFFLVGGTGRSRGKGARQRKQGHRRLPDYSRGTEHLSSF